MKKKLLLICAVLAMFLLVGCADRPDPADLPDTMTSQELLDKSAPIAQMMVDGQYQEVYDLFREDVRETLTVEQVGNLMENIRSKFVEIEKLSRTKTFGGENSAHGIAQYDYKCSNRDIEIRISMDPEYNLIGLLVQVEAGDFDLNNLGKNLFGGKD